MTPAFNIATIYVLLWCLYYMQGTLYPVGTFFSQLLLVVLLLTSLYYCFVANSRYTLPVFFKGLNLLLVMFAVYGGFLIIGGYDSTDYAIHVNSFDYLKRILKSLLPIYSFFVFFREGKITEKSFYFWFVSFALLSVANFYENYQTHLLATLNPQKVEFTNNVGYEFVALIPMCVFFYKKPFVQYACMACCVLFVIMSMKRGAVLVCIICSVLFLCNVLKNAGAKKKMVLVGLSALFCLSVFLFVKKQMDESILFQKRIENTVEGNSSGRDYYYETFASYFWNETHPVQFIFGSGALATLKVSDNLAHNDWLEIAVNQGVLGLFIYAIYWFFWGKMILSRNLDSRTKFVMLLLFIIYFFRTIYSMSYDAVTISSSLVLGCCLSKENKNEQAIYSN